MAVLPSTPEHTDEVSEHPFITRAEKWVSTPGEGRGAYIIRHLEYDPAVVTTAFRDGLLTHMGSLFPAGEGRRETQTDLRAGQVTWPGREVDTSVPNEDARARVRVYVVRNHFYSLTMVYRPTAKLDAQYEQMIAGFKLTSE